MWHVRAPLGSLVASFGVAIAVLAGCRTVEDMQRDYAKKITPTGVEAAPVADTVPAKALRPMKVRVWVDGDYQRQTLRWEDRIVAQFDRANRVLIPQFGVRLAPSPAGGQDTTSTLRQARLKLEGGDAAGAWPLIEPLSRTAKDDPVVQSYACHIAAQRAARADDTVAICKTAVSMEHGIPSTRLALAHVHLVRKEPASALEALQPMESALESELQPGPARGRQCSSS